MRRKRTMLMLVAVMLLCAMTVSAVAANLAEPAVLKRNNQLSARELADIPEVPEVTVEGNMVSNDNGNTHTGYFELSVYMSAKGFQSVGVVLSYDTAVLQPVDWTTGDAVTVTGKTWDNPTVLHTKGADALSGKPALAYTEYRTAAGDDGADDTAGTEQATGRANLYLGADALQYTDLLEERVVTVRFKVAEKADGSGYADVTMPTADAAANGWSEPYTVQLADSAVAQAAIPGSEVFVTVRGEDDVEPKAYAYQADENGVEACTTQFRLVSQKSINQGSSIASGDYAITFFDWDGRVIDAISSPEDAAEAVAAWEQHAVVQARLGNKPGYKFDKWLVVYEDNDGEGLHTVGGTFTSNNEPLDLSDATVRADVADLSDVSGYVNPKDPDSKSVLLQASYSAVEGEVNAGNASGVNTDFNHPDARYKLVEQSYYQYGSTDGVSLGQYAVRCKVERSSALRANEPVIMVLVYLSSGEYLTERVDLENTDNTEFEVVVPRGTESVAYQVLDAHEMTNWTLSVSRSEELRPLKAEILREGAFALIVDEARTGVLTTSSSSVNLACFTDSGLSGVTAGNLTAKKQALADATAAKNAGKPQNEWEPLTRAEAAAALS